LPKANYSEHCSLDCPDCNLDRRDDPETVVCGKAQDIKHFRVNLTRSMASLKAPAPVMTAATDLSFSKERTDTLIHGIHVYPARMHPLLARFLIRWFLPSGGTIVDPFCGSGTTLVESIITKNPSIGVEINPLGVLISRVKTTPLKPRELESSICRLLKEYYSRLGVLHLESGVHIDIECDRLRYWFKPAAIRDLAILKELLVDCPLEQDQAILDFLKVCFSETVRRASNSRAGQFKLHRLAPDKLSRHRPDVPGLFTSILLSNYHRMTEFYNCVCLGGQTEGARALVLEGDNREVDVPEKADLILTSPHYGDNKTSISYGQFSKLSMLWLGYKEEDIRRLDRRPSKSCTNTSAAQISRTLSGVVDKIRRKKESRARSVTAYFDSLYESLAATRYILNQRGIMCLVVGERHVTGTRIPMVKVVHDFMMDLRMKPIAKLSRAIPRKYLPRQNDTVETINREFILAYADCARS